MRVIGFRVESESGSRGEVLLNGCDPVIGLTADSGVGSAELSASGGNLKFGWITPGDFFAAGTPPAVVFLLAVGLLVRLGAEVSSDSVIIGDKATSVRGDDCVLGNTDPPK
jgi:hypothetical protein